MRLIVVVLSLLTCALAADTPEQVLLQADRDFNRATQERRADGWLAYMADDAVLGHQKPVVGKEAVRATTLEMFANPAYSLTWEPTRAEMFTSGDTGYTTGRWEAKGKRKTGEPYTRHGHYLTVWKKQADGSWKVIYDTGSPDPPPAK